MPVQVGDMVRLRIRSGDQEDWPELAELEEYRVYRVNGILYREEEMIEIDGFDTLVYLDEVVEIVNDNINDQLDDSSEALTDFIAGFLSGGA